MKIIKHHVCQFKISVFSPDFPWNGGVLLYFDLKRLLLWRKYGVIKLTFRAVQMQRKFLVTFFSLSSPSVFAMRKQNCDICLSGCSNALLSRVC